MRGSRQSVPNIHKKVPKIIWERGETAPNIFVRSYKDPDRLESIIYDITEKKIDNPHSRLLLCFSL